MVVDNQLAEEFTRVARSVRKFCMVVFVGLCTLAACNATLGCNWTGKQWAKTALDAAQIACIFATDLSDEATIAKICRVEESARDALHAALVGKAEAQRAGICK